MLFRAGIAASEPVPMNYATGSNQSKVADLSIPTHCYSSDPVTSLLLSPSQASASLISSTLGPLALSTTFSFMFMHLN